MAGNVPPHSHSTEKGTSARALKANTSDPEDEPYGQNPKPTVKGIRAGPQDETKLVYTVAEIASVFGTPQGFKVTTLNSTFKNPYTLAFILLFRMPAPNYLGKKIFAKTNTDILLNHPLYANDSHNTRFPEFSHLDVSGAVFPVFHGRGPRTGPGDAYKFWQCLGWFQLSTVQHLEPGSQEVATMLQRKWGAKRRDKQRWLEGLMARWFVIEIESVKEKHGDNPMKSITGRKISIAGRSDVTGNDLYHANGLDTVTLREVLEELSQCKQAAREAERRRETRENERTSGAASTEQRITDEHTHLWLSQVEEPPQTTHESPVRVSEEVPGKAAEEAAEEAAGEAAEEAVEEATLEAAVEVAGETAEVVDEDTSQRESEQDLIQLELPHSPLRTDEEKSLGDIPRWLHWIYDPPGTYAGYLPEPNWW
ncbi:MAG: hypothetical protein Q9187_004912 [Circinaria calcarea]